MITLTKSGNAIVFEFDDNSHYLNDGTIEVPVNSLTLVTDDSQMATFRKAASNDIFISATYDELGMSKADLETWFKENAFDTGGVTEEWVEEYVSESISGKADTSDVQEIASDVSTVSGDVNTLSGSVNALTGAVNTITGDVSTLSGQVQSNETTLTAHTANTDIHVTASDKQNWNNKSDFSGSYNDLTDKPTIPVVPTNVSAFNNDAGYVTQTNIDAAVSGKVNTTDFNTYSANTDARLSEDEEVTAAALNALDEKKLDASAYTPTDLSNYYTKSETSGATQISTALASKADTATTYTKSQVDTAIATKQDTLVSGTNIKTINNESILGSGNITIEAGGNNVIELTQAQYDALTDIDPDAFYIITDAAGAVTTGQVQTMIDDSISGKADTSAVTEAVSGKMDTSSFNTYSAITDARISEDEEVTAAALNSLNDALDDKADTTAVTASISAAVSGKQDTLSAGTNITISGNVISAEGGGKAIEAGRGIAITTGETADTVSFNLPISAGTGANSIIMGLENNIASGTRSFAGGGNNSISKVSATQDFAFAYGTGLNAKGQYSAVFGSSNSVEGNGAFAAGYSNYVYGNYGVGLGQRVISNNDNEVSLGANNVSNKANTTFGHSGNTLFSVGNGTASNARHNAFEIRQNGDIYCSDGTNDVKLQDTITATASNTTALGGLKLVQISQSDYDNLQNKDASTLYIIT